MQNLPCLIGIDCDPYLALLNLGQAEFTTANGAVSKVEKLGRAFRAQHLAISMTADRVIYPLYDPCQ
jgi:hypothetical protein